MKALMMAVILWMVGDLGSMSNAQPTMSEIFEQKYQAWRDYLHSHPEFRFLSQAGPQFDCSQFREIVSLGLPAIPYVAERIARDPNERLLWRAISQIAKVKIRTQYDPNRRETVFPDFPDFKPGQQDVFLYWWREGYKRTPDRFLNYHSEWQALREQRQAGGAQKYSQIVDLGIAALPIIVQKVRHGDTSLIPILSVLTDGIIGPNATTSECSTWWDQNGRNWLIPFPNRRPVARAGEDRTASPGDTARLNGLSSMDPDGSELSYEWVQLSGPRVSLSDATTATPAFVAPELQEQTTLVFQLIVNDAGDLSKAVPTPNSKSLPAVVRIRVNPKR